jgi:hypothetical protein
MQLLCICCYSRSLVIRLKRIWPIEQYEDKCNDRFSWRTHIEWKSTNGIDVFLRVHTACGIKQIYLLVQPRLFPSCVSSMYWLDYTIKASRPDIDLRPYSLMRRSVHSRLRDIHRYIMCVLYSKSSPSLSCTHSIIRQKRVRERKKKGQASPTTWNYTER